MLPSVLFAIRTSKHCSTGFTPFRILYNFDPILQFEYGDKVENSVLSDEEADYQGDMESNAGSNFPGTTTDPVFSKIEKLENQCKEIFNKANKSIKKAQKHQAKCYDNRQVEGKAFEIGCKVLEHNVKDESCKSKFQRKFTGLYLVIGRGLAIFIFCRTIFCIN